MHVKAKMLSAQSQQMYGTVSEEPAVESRSTSKLAVALTAVALLTVGVVAMTAGASSGRMAGALNTEKFTSAYGNTNKVGLAKVSPAVTEVGLKVLNITIYNQRWAIFGFDRAQDEIVPLMTGQATFNWRKDFKLFRGALPEDQAVLAVYNFQYWVSDDEIASDPIMITWAPATLEPEKLANAGYFLGAEILALSTIEDEGRRNTERIIGGHGKHGGPLQRQNNNDLIGKSKGQGFADPPELTGFSGPYRMESMSESYDDFCENEMMVEAKLCSLEKAFHECPFNKAGPECDDDEECAQSLYKPDDPTTSMSPCDMDECAGAEFTKALSERGEIPAACCEYINKEYCPVQDSAGLQGLGFGQAGCHHVTLGAINALCEGAEDAYAVHFGDHAYESFENCADTCLGSCVFFDKPTDTYTNCDGCPVDGDYQCHPGDLANSIQPAYGYMTAMCCGFDPVCESKNADGSPVFADHGSCATQEYHACVWMEQTGCQEEMDRQEIERSDKGCCVLKNGDDVHGTTWEYIDSRAVFCNDPNHADWNVALDAEGNPHGGEVQFFAADAALDQTGGNVCHLLQEEAATKQANHDEHDRIAALPTTPAPEAAAERRV